MNLLKELTEGSHLNIRVRGGRVRVTYGNKGLDLYDAEKTEDGIQLTPVSPWSGRVLKAESWQDAKRQVEERVIRAFRGADQSARFISKKLGV